MEIGSKMVKEDELERYPVVFNGVMEVFRPGGGKTGEEGIVNVDRLIVQCLEINGVRLDFPKDCKSGRVHGVSH